MYWQVAPIRQVILKLKSKPFQVTPIDRRATFTTTGVRTEIKLECCDTCLLGTTFPF